MTIFLASASPQRKKLLSSLGLTFKVIPSDLNEAKLKRRVKSIRRLVEQLAVEKVKAVKNILQKKRVNNFLIIGADSLVAVNVGKHWLPLGKPEDWQEAKKMLLLFKGKSHKFYTGVAVLSSAGQLKTAVDSSTIYFKNFSDKKLERVFKKDIWKDKAGGYDLEEDKEELIEKFTGSDSNILGLPLEKLAVILKEFGLKVNLKDKKMIDV